MTSEQMTKLRASFDDKQIGKLPTIWCKACRDNKQEKHCAQHQKTKCGVCGNNITTAHNHLDYVGHAHVTHRLLDVDAEWTWEPMATDQNGFPVFDAQGGLWIRLTVGGVSRPGYGEPGRTGPKEAIGDAIRNAAMRFGVALELWAKGELDAHEDSPAVSGTSGAAAAVAAPPAAGETHPQTTSEAITTAYRNLEKQVGEENAQAAYALALHAAGLQPGATPSYEQAQMIIGNLELALPDKVPA